MTVIEKTKSLNLPRPRLAANRVEHFNHRCAVAPNQPHSPRHCLSAKKQRRCHIGVSVINPQRRQVPNQSNPCFRPRDESPEPRDSRPDQTPIRHRDLSASRLSICIIFLSRRKSLRLHRSPSPRKMPFGPSNRSRSISYARLPSHGSLLFKTRHSFPKGISVPYTTDGFKLT